MPCAPVFQLPVAHEVESKARTRVLLAAAIRPMYDLGACRAKITGHNTECVGSFRSRIKRRETWCNVSVHGRYGE